MNQFDDFLNALGSIGLITILVAIVGFSILLYLIATGQIQ